MKELLLFVVVAITSPVWLSGFVWRVAANWFNAGGKDADAWADKEIEALQKGTE